MPRAHRTVTPPRHEDVVSTVRIALFNPDQMLRAEAAALLTLWDLPVSPRALVIAARRTMEALPA